VVQSLLILWLLRVDDVPHSDVFVIQVIVHNKSNHNGDHHPILALEASADKLEPHAENINNSDHSVERENNLMLSVDVLGRKLTTKRDASSETAKNAKWEVDDWKLTLLLALLAVESGSIFFWALS